MRSAILALLFITIGSRFAFGSEPGGVGLGALVGSGLVGEVFGFNHRLSKPRDDFNAFVKNEAEDLSDDGDEDEESDTVLVRAPQYLPVTWRAGFSYMRFTSAGTAYDIVDEMNTYQLGLKWLTSEHWQMGFDLGFHVVPAENYGQGDAAARVAFSFDGFSRPGIVFAADASVFKLTRSTGVYARSSAGPPTEIDCIARFYGGEALWVVPDSLSIGFGAFFYSYNPGAQLLDATFDASAAARQFLLALSGPESEGMEILSFPSTVYRGHLNVEIGGGYFFRGSLGIFNLESGSDNPVAGNAELTHRPEEGLGWKLGMGAVFASSSTLVAGVAGLSYSF